jgi:hypothetical protein
MQDNDSRCLFNQTRFARAAVLVVHQHPLFQRFVGRCDKPTAITFGPCRPVAKINLQQAAY